MVLEALKANIQYFLGNVICKCIQNGLTTGMLENKDCLLCFANLLFCSSFYSRFTVFSVVPHITDAIQEWVMKQARISVDDDGVEPQVCVIEVKSSQQVLQVDIRD